MSDDRSLDEIFRYELNKRSSAEGIARAALGGDRQAIRNFAGLSIVAIEDNDSDLGRSILPWLLFVLGQIQSGIEPNVAFRWARRRKGAPSPSQDMKGLTKRWMIGQHMTGLIEAGASQRGAAKVVASDRNVSEQEAIRCHREWGEVGPDK